MKQNVDMSVVAILANQVKAGAARERRSSVPVHNPGILLDAEAANLV